MRHYELDLTACTLPDDFPLATVGNPHVLPICEGQYQKDFDVEEGRLPGWREKYDAYMSARNPERLERAEKAWPVGFDEHELPRGAVIRSSLIAEPNKEQSK